MSKATKRQMLEREEDIQAAIAEGKTPKEFSEDLARKHKCSAHSIERQYRAIINEMIEIQKEARGELKVKLMARNDLLYKKALEAGNVKNAMDSINLQAKLGGLYEPKKEKKEETKQPVFNFVEKGDANLTVVREDDDDDDAVNN